MFCINCYIPMKVFFLYLIIIVNSETYYTEKIPFGFTLIPITCEEAFESKVKFKNSKIFYENKLVMGHYCIDEFGNYWDGNKEKLDYELR